jgi:tRNA (guanine-N7-)-methyltransferase
MPALSDKAPARPIRSYVLRAGRITPAQERALAELWPRYGVDFRPAELNLPELFARRAPVSLEIGFGNGEHLLRRASAEPERNFLGVEVHRPGIGHLLLAAERNDLKNLRIVAHDAVEVLEQQIAPGSLDEVQLLFPDPWPKKRHHKRRLVQPAFINLLASRLGPGGKLYIATDWQPYAERMREDLEACAALRNSAELLAGARADSIQTEPTHEPTRFQRRGERLGHQIHRLLFVRVGD